MPTFPQERLQHRQTKFVFLFIKPITYFAQINIISKHTKVMFPMEIQRRWEENIKTDTKKMSVKKQAINSWQFH
jgi:hypothetical protein